jgi:hypothetical protein
MQRLPASQLAAEMLLSAAEDSIKLIICAGFTRSIMACSLSSDSCREMEGHDSVAAGD